MHIAIRVRPLYVTFVGRSVRRRRPVPVDRRARKRNGRFVFFSVSTVYGRPVGRSAMLISPVLFTPHNPLAPYTTCSVVRVRLDLFRRPINVRAHGSTRMQFRDIPTSRLPLGRVGRHHIPSALFDTFIITRFYFFSFLHFFFLLVGGCWLG